MDLATGLIPGHERIPASARVLGIGGSPRAGGNSDLLLGTVLAAVADAGVPVESVHLREREFSPCIGCERCRTEKACTALNDGMTPIYSSVAVSSGLVLVSPTHNYNITAWMKAFIDRLYCFYDFEEGVPRGWSSRLAGQGRKAAIVGICEQVDEYDMGYTLDAMRRPLEALGYEITGELPVYRVFRRGGVGEDEEVLAAAAALGHRMAEALTR